MHVFATFVTLSIVAAVSVAQFTVNGSVDYAQPMEGFVTTDEDRRTRGYPAVPDQRIRGANVFAGWTATNNFLRHFFIAYDVLTGAGEFKHGLWSWHMENASIPLWWCELGGLYTGTDGLADSPTPSYDNGAAPQSGMQAIWAQIDKSPNANKYGPLAKRAGLDRLAASAIRVHLNADAELWMNRNSSMYPFLTPVGKVDGHYEIYLFRAPYGAQLYDTPECPPGTDIVNASAVTCGLMKTHVAVIPSKSVSDRAVTFPSWGIAFDRKTECPECRGKSCQCDALLIDLAFSAYLTDREPLELFVPNYVLPPKAAIEGYNIAQKEKERHPMH